MARTFDELGQALEKRKAEADATTQQIRKQQQRQKALYDLNLTITSTLDLTSVLNIFLILFRTRYHLCSPPARLPSAGSTNNPVPWRSSRTATLTRPMKCQTESQSSKDFPW